MQTTESDHHITPDAPVHVTYLFRKSEGFFSIERIFKQLEPEFSKKIEVGKWTAPYARFSFRAVLGNILAARKCKGDIFHVTGHLHYLVLGLPQQKTVLTIHDCVFLYRWKGWKRLVLKWFFLDLPVRYSRIITTISEATRMDIIRHTHCNPDKIIVVPNPLDSSIYFTEKKFCKEKPVMLFIGSTPHKNLARLIVALENISCHLEIVGRLLPGAKELLEKYKISYSICRNISDEEMAHKYAGCDMVVFPTTFEGFGLPIIEGQKAGRPVLTSNLMPMKDVAGGAACLVDPYDIKSIRAGILKLIADEAYRNKLVEDGFKNIERYAASQVAECYMTCYKKILSI